MTVLLRNALQNATEGNVTAAVRKQDVFIGCEIDRDRVRDGLPGWAHFFPARDPHQSISWNPAVFKATFKGYERYHRSGTAERWPGIKTPARGVIFVRGHHRDLPDVPLTLWGTWLLNSWNPAAGHDRHTDERRRIVDDLELPLLRTFLRREHQAGRVTIGGGDMNSLPWSGHLPGVTQVKPRGLDRAYISDDPRATLRGNVTEGPTTGVGPQMRHKSTLFTVALKETR